MRKGPAGPGATEGIGAPAAPGLGMYPSFWDNGGLLTILKKLVPESNAFAQHSPRDGTGAAAMAAGPMAANAPPAAAFDGIFHISSLISVNPAATGAGMPAAVITTSKNSHAS